MRMPYNRMQILRQGGTSICAAKARFRRPGGYSHTLPIWVCAAHLGRDFEAPDLEWGISFRGVF